MWEIQCVVIRTPKAQHTLPSWSVRTVKPWSTRMQRDGFSCRSHGRRVPCPMRPDASEMRQHVSLSPRQDA